VPPNKLLLHVCCGPCATHAIESLQQTYRLTLFFSNSNIAPPEEYRRRLKAARLLAERRGLQIVEDTYDHRAWLTHVRGLATEPEGGRRCEKCFAFNLGRTARYARTHAFDLFTTTLTVSPHKDAQVIFRTGQQLGDFLCVDLKKGDGFKRSVELSRALGLYRQSSCGCEFSTHGKIRP